MDAVKLARGTRVIENRRQERFVEEFHRFILKKMECTLTYNQNSIQDKDIFTQPQTEPKEQHSAKKGSLAPLLLSPRRDSEDLCIYSPLPLNSTLYNPQSFSPSSNTGLKSVKSYDSLLLLQRNFKQ